MSSRWTLASSILTRRLSSCRLCGAWCPHRDSSRQRWPRGGGRPEESEFPVSGSRYSPAAAAAQSSERWRTVPNLILGIVPLADGSGAAARGHFTLLNPTFGGHSRRDCQRGAMAPSNPSARRSRSRNFRRVVGRRVAYLRCAGRHLHARELELRPGVAGARHHHRPPQAGRRLQLSALELRYVRRRGLSDRSITFTAPTAATPPRSAGALTPGFEGI